MEGEKRVDALMFLSYNEHTDNKQIKRQGTVANLNKSTKESWCTFCSFGARDSCVQFTKVELKSSSLRRRSCQAQS